MKKIVVTMLVVGLMTMVAQAATVTYTLVPTDSTTWELYVDVSGSDTAGLSTYAMYVDDLGVADWTQGSLTALKYLDMGPPMVVEYNGFTPIPVEGDVGGRFNFGNYQNSDATLLPISGIGAGIEGIGKVAFSETQAAPYSPVPFAKPALLGILTTSAGLVAADFEAEPAGLLNADSSGFIDEVTPTLIVIPEPVTLSLLVLGAGGLSMIRRVQRRRHS